MPESRPTQPAPFRARVLPYILLLIWAPVGAVAIAFAGGLTWNALARMNRRIYPDVPWAAGVMLAITALVWRMFAGWSRARTSSAAQPHAFRRFWPADPPTPWTLLAVLSATSCTLSMIFVGMRIGHFAKDAFAPSVNMRALPPQLAYSGVLMTALVAGFFEESGFRGFLQYRLERPFGPAFAIGVTSVLFYAMHLTHGWAQGDLVTTLAVAAPMVLGSVLLGTMAYLTSAIGPSMVVHTLIDVVALPLEWDLISGLNLTSVTSTGLDRHFVIWSLALVLSGCVTTWSLFRLSRLRANGSS